MWKLLALLTLIASPVLAEMQRIGLGQRFYLIDLADQPSGALIVALHGAGGSPGQLARMTELAAAGTAQGYAVVFAAGSGAGGQATWNAFHCCGQAVKTQVDDLAFLDSVMDDAARRFGLDGRRVYLTGMSNGAMMAQTYAVLRPDRVRAVAGVSGTLDLSQVSATPVPLLHIHGDADAVVPYAGGRTRNLAAAFTPVSALIAAFVAAHGGLARSSRSADPVDDGTAVRIDDYTDAQGVVQVRLITVQGGGHAWPGAAAGRRPTSQDISATAEVLAFFALHP